MIISNFIALGAQTYKVDLTTFKSDAFYFFFSIHWLSFDILIIGAEGAIREHINLI